MLHSTYFRKRGFTLIELLIVISIVSLLIQLMLPAVQASRESARQTQCKNNLRQLAMGCLVHSDSIGHLPTSGWGYQWTGHPDRGFGKDQPGGWAYNILPYIELGSLRELGSGLEDGTKEQSAAVFLANSTPIPLFNCSSRREAKLYPVDNKGFSPLLPSFCLEGDAAMCGVARSDYAINSGSTNFLPGSDSGPPSLSEADTWNWNYYGIGKPEQNGVSYQKSMVRLEEITDGLSQTYCIGEKFMQADEYETGLWPNDDQGVFVGHDGDMNRYTGDNLEQPLPLQRDTLRYKYLQFGSAHPTTCHMSFVDGSVQAVSYDIDPEVHRVRGGRSDAIIE